MKKVFATVIVMCLAALMGCDQPLDPIKPAQTLNGTSWVMDFTEQQRSGNPNPQYIPSNAQLLRYMVFGGDKNGGLIVSFEEIRGWTPGVDVQRYKSGYDVSTYTVKNGNELTVTNPNGSVVSAVITGINGNEMTVRITEAGVEKPLGTLTRLASAPPRSTKQMTDYLSGTTWKSSTDTIVQFNSPTEIVIEGTTYPCAQVINNNGGDIMFDLYNGSNQKIGSFVISMFTLKYGSTSYFKQ